VTDKLIAYREIAGARVLREFRHHGERMRPDRLLAPDEVLTISPANRRTLVDGGFLEIYNYKARDGHGRPLWIAPAQAWICHTLDAQDAAFHRKLANEAKAYIEHHPRFASRVFDDDEKARRKEHGLAKTREWLEQMAAERYDVETLRRLFPAHAALINRPKRQRGKRFQKPPHPAHVRLEQALAELPRTRALLKIYRQGKPKGQLTAEQVLGARWDLDKSEIRRRHISRARLKRERA
jgi:hypothetical protein